MKKLRIIFESKNKILIWDDVIVPIWIVENNCPKPILNRSVIKQVVQKTSGPKVTREATERTIKLYVVNTKSPTLSRLPIRTLIRCETVIRSPSPTQRL